MSANTHTMMPPLAVASVSGRTLNSTMVATVTKNATLATLTNITCSEEVTVLDAAATGGRFFAESDSVAATGTGATRTCKLSIPYAWSLATQSSDNMSTSYSVSGLTSTGLPQRTSSLSPLDTRKVPTSGTTTALTAAVTL